MSKRKITAALMVALTVPLVASCGALLEPDTNTHYAAYIVRETLVKTPTTDSFVGTIGDRKIEINENPSFAVMEQRLEKISKNERLPIAKLTIKKGGAFVLREEETNEVLYDSDKPYAVDFWADKENFELPEPYKMKDRIENWQ